MILKNYRRTYFVLFTILAANISHASLSKEDAEYAKSQGMMLQLPCAHVLKQALQKEFCDFIAKTNIHNTLANLEMLPIALGTHLELAFLTYSQKTADKRTVIILKRRKAEIIELISPKAKNQLK